MEYDNSNIFNKILNKNIPCDKIYEDEEILCFKDINPIANIHVLIIPKEKYISFDDFVSNADEGKISSFFKKIKKIASQLNIDKDGYRLVFNCNEHGGQTVYHIHLHLLGGRPLNWPPG